MKVGLWDYIKAAFNARPAGMFVAPNWVALAALGLLGALYPDFLPGILLIGSGLELAYLYLVSTNKRFQRYVAGSEMVEERAESQTKLRQMLMQLGDADIQRYRALEQRCQAILQQQQAHLASENLSDLQVQGEGLGKLLWIYLRLLLSRQAFTRLMREAMAADKVGEPLERRIRLLQSRLDDESIGDDLRKSLSGQLEILEQRLKSQREAREKLAFLNAEITRIEEQVELIREQAVLSTDPTIVSNRIDQIAATLSGTSQWIRDQQQAYGEVQDVLEEPPQVLVQPGMAREAQ